MQKADKERLIEDLTERLRSADVLLVADYRGLTNSQLASLRVELLNHGARLSVVKNTLTRRAAEAAGADALLALLEGPTAIAFVAADGNPVAVAKALSDTAKQTNILTLRGGVLSGTPISAADIESLAELPPLDVLKAQLVGVIVAPAEPARCGVERTAPEPGGPDRRQNHAARWCRSRRGRQSCGGGANRRGRGRGGCGRRTGR